MAITNAYQRTTLAVQQITDDSYKNFSLPGLYVISTPEKCFFFKSTRTPYRNLEKILFLKRDAKALP
jgi:hypothetical protein